MKIDFAKRGFCYLALAAMLGLTVPTRAYASIPASQATEATDQDEKKERKKNDYDKVIHYYVDEENKVHFYCNTNRIAIRTADEAQRFIAANWSKYFTGDLPKYTTVDEVIKGLDENNADFNYKQLIIDFYNLDREDEVAVKAFLELYGPHYAEIALHNYFVLEALRQGIRREGASFIKDIVDHNYSDYIGDPIEDFLGCDLSTDLTTVNYHYSNCDINVDLTTPNDGSEWIIPGEPNEKDPNMKIKDETKRVGDGFADIRAVYDELVGNSEVFAGYAYSLTGYDDEFLEKYYSGSPLKAEDYTFTDSTSVDIEQIYSVGESDKVHKLIEEGVGVLEKLSPGVGINTELAEELYGPSYVTDMGYGRWVESDSITKGTKTLADGTVIEHTTINVEITIKNPNLDRDTELKKHPEIKQTKLEEEALTLTYKANH